MGSSNGRWTNWALTLLRFRRKSRLSDPARRDPEIWFGRKPEVTEGEALMSNKVSRRNFIKASAAGAGEDGTIHGPACGQARGERGSFHQLIAALGIET